VLGICWYLERFSRREMGFVVGRAEYYGLGLLHPVLVLSLLALVAWMTGATAIQNPDWSTIALTFAIQALATMLVTLVTEDGFFRGWLWASLKQAGLNEHRVVLVTGIAFGIWHLPYGILGTGYDPLSAALPLYIINASLIGVAWGLLRLISGSVVVAAVTHGIWNATAYVFFNNGAEIGVFGIQDIATYGPEAGGIGLALNLVYTLGLWVWYRRAAAMRVVPQAERPQPEPGARVSTQQR
jgi:membrane protease YdiL (CAAX protease family)